MDNRPDPDKILKRLKQEETVAGRGTIKIFFGSSAGVGKTYAMLEAARQRLREGVEVVVGLVETHGRTETAAMLSGLEQLPLKSIEYKGVVLQEFDLDAALARKPKLLLVDELAHTNAPGCRHPKRWQDIQELLDRGISVYTTLNVQHIDSQNDVITQITGIPVRETVPDSAFEQADEVELVDLPPDELLKRLSEGKVYLPEQAKQASANFFRKGNLVALREIALRVTADRINAQVQLYREDQNSPRVWRTAERLLVCVSPSHSSLHLVRSACRMAKRLYAEWIALYVETPNELRFPEAVRARAVQHLRLAERLGAETITLSGHNLTDEILSYAHARNVTTIVVGQPLAFHWKDRLFGSPVDRLIRASGDIHIHVVRGEMHEPEPFPTPHLPHPDRSPYWMTPLVIAGVTLLCWLVFPYLALVNLVMLYLLGVVLVAWYWGRGPSVLASVLSVLAFDFFFVPPRFTFAVADYEYVLTFAVMLGVALVISGLTSLVRKQAETSRLRERRTAALHALSRELAANRGIDKLLEIAVRHIGEVFESQVIALLPDAQGKLLVRASWPGTFSIDGKEQSVAQWAYDVGDLAGQGTDTLPSAESLYVPMMATERSVGTLGVRPKDPARLLIPDQLHLFEAFAHQTGLAIECDRLSEEGHQNQVEMETERLRNAILSSVPHDLRTPLAAITGSASSLVEAGEMMSPMTRKELAQNICDEAERLTSVVNNVLDVTKLESGTLTLNKETLPMEEILGAALSHLEKKLIGRPIETAVAPDLPMIPMDGKLMQQVFLNLLDNALKYTPENSAIDLSVSRDKDFLVVEVADRGPGLPEGDPERLFEKFYRGDQKGREGFGLGLTICRGIVQAHGGRILAENRPGGGAVFRFSLPIQGA